MKVFKLSILFLMAMALIMSCGSALDDSTGSMEISIDNGIGSRFIAPPISMDAAEYEITITGPSNSTQTVTGDTVIGGLLPGTYAVSVVAKNDTGVGIGAGSAADIVVAVGDPVPVNIDVTENTAIDGSLSGSIAWEPDILNNPTFEGYLLDNASVQTDLTFAMDIPNTTATVGVDPLAVGYYTIITRLYDGPDLSTGFAEVVRVVSGYETTFSKTLAANLCFGGIDIIMSVDMNDPLNLTFDPMPSTIDLYNESQTINLVSVDEAGYLTSWYVNGEQVQVDGDSYTFDTANYAADSTQRLDCIVYSTDGSRANSESWIFNVVSEPIELPVVVTFDSTVTGNYSITFTAKNGGETKSFIDNNGGAVVGRNEIACDGIVPGEYELSAIWGSGSYVYFDPATGNPVSSAPATYITIPNTEFAEFYLGSF